MHKQVLNQRPRPDLDAIFAALAHPTRRAIIEQLAEGERTVGELAAPHDVSLPAISQHLRVLEDAGLLMQTKDGRLRICALEAAPLSTAFSWILRYRVFWEDVLDDIQRSVEQGQEAEAASAHPAVGDLHGTTRNVRP
jgi:DNA-binding transcriptional ArsR family regulator